MNGKTCCLSRSVGYAGATLALRTGMYLDFSHLRIAVIGDLILDRYLDGSVRRISPEAPVAVVLKSSERDVLGGAANVVANIAALGAQVRVAGVVGQDANGTELVKALAHHENVSITTVAVDPDRPTTCKMRVVNGLYQIVRIDTESDAYVSGGVETKILSGLSDLVGWADVVVLSDYGKGVCSDTVIRAVIEESKRRGKPCIVDPKRSSFDIYEGASLIKPNKRELAGATGQPCDNDAQVEAAAKVALAQTGSAILLTRSEQGMSYFTPDGEIVHLPTAARDVFDVSGAGDTVVALMAIGFANHMPVPETMRLANVAAGLVVGKIGTAVIDADELRAAIREQAHHPSYEKGELVSRMDAVQQREIWRREGLRVGFTNGCYDLLHPGHISLLRQAAKACDRLIVALNADASVRRLKGPTRPVQDELSRALVLGALSVVDLVVIFEEDTPAELIRALQPDLLVKGADYSESQVVGADFVRSSGGRTLLVPLVQGQSTTSMIRRSLEVLN